MARIKKERKQKKSASKIRRIIEGVVLVVAVCVFVYAAINLFAIWRANTQEEVVIERVREEMKAPTTEEKLDSWAPDFAKLQETNPDVVGWIVVLDTDISYPVVKGSDNEYYLNHLWDKKSNYAGAIFMDYRHQGDLSNLNTFIYGHNVHHGTMFAELENYMKESFFNEHPYVYYYTPAGNYKLQVFSAYVDKGDAPSYQNGIHISDASSYQNYIDYIKSLSRYDSGVELTTNDHMITLYTCSYENGVNPGNTEAEYIDDRYYIHCKVIEALSGEMPFDNTND